MPVHLKSAREVEGIRAAGRVVAGALAAAGKAVGPGRTLKQLEQVCDEYIRSHGGYPTFLGYRGFPAAVCIGVNEEVCTGYPDTGGWLRGTL